MRYTVRVDRPVLGQIDASGLTADEQIRLDLQVEESQFLPAVGEALVEVDRNTAQTAMTVRSGQTIVVGGLNVRRAETTNAGLPWLRRIPILNLLTADQSSFDQNKEVVVYLTPYIWNPNLDPPIARPRRDGEHCRVSVPGPAGGAARRASSGPDGVVASRIAATLPQRVSGTGTRPGGRGRAPSRRGARPHLRLRSPSSDTR